LERIIITGGSGFIGRHLVEKILSKKISSIALVANTPNVRKNQFEDKKLKHDAPLTSNTVDIRDKKRILEVFDHEKAETCIHLAAKISVADSINNPEETMDINVKGTLNVLEACSNNKVKNFVFASSAAVYGDVTELPISENHSLKPLSPYGTSKMLAEELVLRYYKLNKIQNAASLRIFNVYGNGQSSEADVITLFAKRLSKGLPPEIHGDGKNTRDFISVDDVTEAILLSVKAMEEPKSNYNDNLNLPPVFNVGTGTPTSIKDLAKKMIAISGLKVEPIYKKGNQGSGIILHSYADMTEAKKALHFVAKKNLETGLREIIEQMHVSQGIV
jgi:UDP-glucose 4-epimerase